MGVLDKLFLSRLKGRNNKQTTSEEQMKFNKLTLGLAAVGAVSLASAVRADEAKIIPLQTTLANTTISGYVDTAVQYNAGNVTGASQQPAGTFAGKVDNFSLNDFDIAIDRPADSTPWAAGYHADINAGTDAVGYTFHPGGPGAASPAGLGAPAIRQAYVTLTTPVGNGITWKMGVQDDIIGYEGNTDAANPNYTRSIGYYLEPTTLIGLVGSYQINSMFTIQGGIADPTTSDGTVSAKSFVGALAFTAPDSWGFLKGGTANLGIVANPYKSAQYNYYAGFTIPTPLSMLKVGGSFDLVSVNNQAGAANPNNDSGWDLAGYANIQATDKLAFNLRGEVYDLKGAVNPYYSYEPLAPTDGVGEELTATVQYNLWANVTSRAEFRWDHSDGGYPYGGYGAPIDNGTPTQDSFIMALNIIYSF
jgi:hypothetical protein